MNPASGSAQSPALRLSPLDPLRFYFDALAATAALSAGQYQRALQLAEQSYRLNRTHASTLRSMITALWSLGREADARSVVVELLKLDPTYCVQKFIERSPAAPYQFGRTVAAALEAAGIPMKQSD